MSPIPRLESQFEVCVLCALDYDSSYLHIGLLFDQDKFARPQQMINCICPHCTIYLPFNSKFIIILPTMTTMSPSYFRKLHTDARPCLLCIHTFTLFRLIKTSVIVETYQIFQCSFSLFASFIQRPLHFFDNNFPFHSYFCNICILFFPFG